MSVGGLGTAPQDIAANAINEQKKWEAVKKAKEGAENEKFSAAIANIKSIRF
ncbi:hypothetical protein VRB50_03350 [Pseudomonas poae]|uniref:Uncharacterized protein n=1 Tax=Pseudomonas poae TaxID=200451 RepID=A0ABY0RHE3_9PSED|nr:MULTISPECIES: hypothetical protein [Pseudomonas]MCF5775823.1 hypothetical protein [Pseudomonas poae]NMZ48966.1 hypothetical protein [Pseudomonas poae]CRL99400.1 hypothetical protein [Pseudomonas sp. 25 E 4]SDO09274.1 hypothetical protein SAMN04490208_2509 [Pseudomonas poae]